MGFHIRSIPPPTPSLLPEEPSLSNQIPPDTGYEAGRPAIAPHSALHFCHHRETMGPCLVWRSLTRQHSATIGPHIECQQRDRRTDMLLQTLESAGATYRQLPLVGAM